MANVYQGEIDVEDGVSIIAVENSMVVTSIIINNLSSDYSFTLYRVSSETPLISIPIYNFLLESGDTIRDSYTYSLDKGDYLKLVTNIEGTTYYITTV